MKGRDLENTSENRTVIIRYLFKIYDYQTCVTFKTIILFF